MRTAQLLVATLILIGASASARPLQDPMGGPPPGPPPDVFGGSAEVPSAKGQLKRLSRLLKLSDEQQKKVQSILEAQKQQLDKLKQEQEDSDDTQAVRDVQNETSAKIRELLNEEQKAKFDEYEQKQQAAREHRGGEMPPPPPPF